MVEELLPQPPGYDTKATESKDSSGKAKVWCTLCFEARIAHVNALDGYIGNSGCGAFKVSNSGYGCVT